MKYKAIRKSRLNLFSLFSVLRSRQWFYNWKIYRSCRHRILVDIQHWRDIHPHTGFYFPIWKSRLTNIFENKIKNYQKRILTPYYYYRFEVHLVVCFEVCLEVRFEVRSEVHFEVPFEVHFKDSLRSFLRSFLKSILRSVLRSLLRSNLRSVLRSVLRVVLNF